MPRRSPWPLRSRRGCRVGSPGRACGLWVVGVGAPEERRLQVDGVELAEDGIRRPDGVAVLGGVDGALGRRAQQRRRRTLLVERRR